MNFALISLGCSKNLVDSENLTGILVNRKGFQLTNEIEEADLVLINTCGFIGDAKKESIETILEVAEYKQERLKTTPPHTAYLKISEGCNRRCTYCIIPQLRGDLRSRTKEDILEEAKRLVSGGVRELNLLAQETTEYGIDNYGKKALPDLLRELVKIEGLDWIRTYYMFPRSITDELIEVMKQEEKICKYFDIPIQHISSNMLRRMGRAITGEQTKELLYKIRKEIPEAVFRTSLIVGFPGETEEEFQELKDFVEEFQFDYIGVFQYSREEDTVAYTMENQIPEEVKERRQAELINLQNEIAESKNRKLLGREVEVLIDGISSESEYMLEGRLKTQALDIDGKVLTSEGTAQVGEMVRIMLEQNFEYDFIGRIVQNEK